VRKGSTSSRNHLEGINLDWSEDHNSRSVMRIGSADLLDGIVGFQSQFRNGGGGEAREIPNARKKKLIQNLFIFYYCKIQD
jgi:hypothetical protein